VDEARRLLRDGPHERRVAMPERAHRDPGVKVEVAPVTRVPDDGALAAHQHEIRPAVARVERTTAELDERGFRPCFEIRHGDFSSVGRPGSLAAGCGERSAPAAGCSRAGEPRRTTAGLGGAGYQTTLAIQSVTYSMFL